MDYSKSIAVLNSLVSINNDRIEGYNKAQTETDDRDLKILFSHFAATSQNCKTELAEMIHDMGGEVAQSTDLTSQLHRIWMDIKGALTSKDRKSVLDSCEFGESSAVETYEKALTDDIEYLTTDQQTLVNGQRLLIKAHHDKIVTLRALAASENA
jgi:uncharacterized protein (TIGR02284 family)